eukprot:1843444-Amphidinium_carterae.1
MAGAKPIGQVDALQREAGEGVQRARTEAADANTIVNAVKARSDARVCVCACACVPRALVTRLVQLLSRRMDRIGPEHKTDCRTNRMD